MPAERRTLERRELDKELQAMSQKALDKANSVESTINIHLAVCESQNRDIIRRLGNQDRILFGIAAAIGYLLLQTVWAKLFS